MASFDDQVKAFAKKANMSVEKTIKGTSIKLFSAVIKSSPVDSGRFRANWLCAGTTPVPSVVDMTDKTGSSATSEMVSYIKSAKGQMVFTLANNLPYAHMLEYGGYATGFVGPQQSTSRSVNGYSRQAPNGMVRVNVARFQAILDEQARANR